jgi:hypothetical protein
MNKGKKQKTTDLSYLVDVMTPSQKKAILCITSRLGWGTSLLPTLVV